MKMIMKQHLLIGLLSLCVLSACSTYKTSSKDIRFNGTQFHEKPVIPVGNIDVDNENIGFMGWIEAFVTSPNLFKPAPTEQQANYVLAHEAKKQGADALLHVNYKKSITPTGQSRIVAKGQAIKLRLKEDSNETSDIEEDVGVFEMVGEDSPGNDAFIATQVIDVKTQESHEPNMQALSAVGQEPDTGIDDSIEAQSSQLMISAAGNNAPASSSALILRPQAKKVENTSGVQLIQHLNSFYDDELNRIQVMMNNALFLRQQAKKYHDKTALQAAERLIEQLQLQQQAFSIFKPAQ